MRDQLLYDVRRDRRVRIFRFMFGERKLAAGVDVVLDVRRRHPDARGELFREEVREQLFGLDWSILLVTLFVEVLLPLILEWIQNRSPEKNPEL